MAANKYHSFKVEYKGEKFDSGKELNRYLELKFKEDRGEISYLTRQVRFEILPQLTRTEVKHLKTKDKLVERVEEKAKYYTCDFQYMEGGVMVVEDVKSKATMTVRDYPLRRHLIKMKLEKLNADMGKEAYIFREVT